jgi:hypothetical protein
LCWCPTEGTPGLFPCAMSGKGEDIVDHLDFRDLQFLWQGKRCRPFHLLHAILLHKYFYVERSIGVTGASELHRECVRTEEVNRLSGDE